MPIGLLAAIGDPTGANQAVVEAGSQALRVTSRPYDHTSGQQGLVLGTAGGHYSVGAFTGLTVSIGAAGILLSFRGAAVGGPLCVLQKIAVSSQIGSTITTATAVNIAATVMRAFTASDTSGTAKLPGTTRNRGTMPLSAIQDLRVASTGAVAAGTNTADTQPFAVANLVAQTSVTAIGGGAPLVSLYDVAQAGQYPVVLAQNEGINIVETLAGPVSGSIIFSFTVVWAELYAF